MTTARNNKVNIIVVAIDGIFCVNIQVKVPKLVKQGVVKQGQTTLPNPVPIHVVSWKKSLKEKQI